MSEEKLDTNAIAETEEEESSVSGSSGALERIMYIAASVVFLGVGITLFCFFASSMGDVSDFVSLLSGGLTSDALLGAVAGLLTMAAFGAGTLVAVGITFLLARRAYASATGIMKLVCLGLVILAGLLALAVVIMLLIALTMVI